MNTLRSDTRAWLLAVVSALCALAAANVGFPSAHRVIDRILPMTIYGFDSDVLLTALFAIISLVVLPIALTLVARRRYLLWGFVPGLFVCFWATVRGILAQGKDELSNDWLSWAVIPLSSFLLTCGPVSLYRYTRQRKAQRLAALHQAMQDAQTPQEGVWPPPPRRP